MFVATALPNDVGNDDDWSRSGGSDKPDAVSSNDADTSYIYSSTVGQRQEFEWAGGGTHAASSGMMIMAVRFVVIAKMSAGTGSIYLTIRRGTSSAKRVVALPSSTPITLSTSYARYELTLVNQPFPGVHGTACAWTPATPELNDYHWGVEVASASGGSVRVTQLKLEVVQRAEVTLDELLTADKSEVFQWAEIEGIRWVPSTRQLAVGDDWSAGAYYYGVEHRPCAGTLGFRAKLRGGKINHAKGKEEIETAQLTLLDATEVAHEHDPDDGEPVRWLYPQGFYSWLLAYGDETNIVRTRMVDSSGSSKNTVKGCDPKEWSGSYGREFWIASAVFASVTSGTRSRQGCSDVFEVWPLDQSSGDEDPYCDENGVFEDQGSTGSAAHNPFSDGNSRGGSGSGFENDAPDDLTQDEPEWAWVSWVYIPTGTSTDQDFLVAEDSAGEFVRLSATHSAGSLYLDIAAKSASDSASGTSATAFDFDTWHLIAITREGNYLKGYLDAVEVISESLTGYGYPTSGTVTVTASDGIDAYMSDLGYYQEYVTGAYLASLYGSEGDPLYLYVGRETMLARKITSTVIGDSADSEALERGAFSSLNRAHEYNVQTGVYPEVTDHPTCWAGRWVRIWQNAIDPVSGYPMPMSVAQARLYVWKSHTQTVGPGRAEYTVRLGPAEELLKRPVAQMRGAQADRVSVAHESGAHGSVAVWEGTTEYRTLFTPDACFDSPAEMLDYALDTGVAGLADVDGNTPNGAWLPWSNGDRLVIKTRGHTTVPKIMFHGVGEIFGWPNGEFIEPDNLSDFQGSGLSSGDTLIFTAPQPAKAVYVGRYSPRVYLQDGHTDDWPDLVDPVAGKVRTVLQVGGKQGVLRTVNQITSTVQNDGSFDYVMAGHPHALARFITSKELGAGSTKRDLAPSVTIGLMFLDVEVHQFFLWCMLSTGFAHNHATYDKLHRWFGLGIDARLVDVDGWEQAGQAVQYNWRSWFLLEPVELLELLEEELAFPSGLVFRQDDQGRLLLDWPRMPLASNDSVPSVLQEHWQRGRAVQVEHSDRMLVNSITVELDYDPIEEKYRRKLVAREPNSIERNGERSRKSKHRGMRSEHIGSNPLTSASPNQIFWRLSEYLFERFAFELPVIKGTITQRGLALRPGQTVWVTQNEIADPQDRTATGVTARGAEILKIDKDEHTGACEVELLTDDRSRRRAGYAPAMMIESWTGGTSTATVYANKFSESAKSETDAGFFTVGDKVVVFEGNDTTPSIKETTIASISGNEITFGDALGFTPADGDVIIWGDYDDLTTGQADKAYAAISSGGYVDSGDSVEAFTYSL